MAKAAIVGGGTAGVTAALVLAKTQIECTLFEKQNSLISGPPFCHLHAGGNLYPNITDKERIQLLKESVEFAKYYPFCVDYRPTVIIYPKRYKEKIEDFIPKLKMLKKVYVQEVKSKILGAPDEYYKLFYKDELLKLAKLTPKEKPANLNEWMIPAAKYIDLERVQFPIIAVQEFGLNLFRLSAGAQLILKELKNVQLNLNSEIINITKKDRKFEIEYKSSDGIKRETFDYLINAAGFLSGKIDDMLGVYKERMVEFKAAYVAKWESGIKFPEIVFQGERGTDRGMAQFTPYNGQFYQLHGMTEEITLYPDGLAKNNTKSSQPKLPASFLKKIYEGWDEKEINLRTQRAIEHAGYFIPQFAKEAKPASVPLFGAQQIPGYNIELRGTEAEFEDNYARCEIVKVSSAITMAKEIAKELKRLKLTDKEYTEDFSYLEKLNLQKLDTLAQKIAKERGYPKEMGRLFVNCS